MAVSTQFRDYRVLPFKRRTEIIVNNSLDARLTSCLAPLSRVVSAAATGAQAAGSTGGGGTGVGIALGDPRV